MIVLGSVLVILGFCMVCVSRVLIGMIKISSRKMVSGVISVRVMVCLCVLVFFNLCLSLVVELGIDLVVIVMVFNVVLLLLWEFVCVVVLLSW